MDRKISPGAIALHDTYGFLVKYNKVPIGILLQNNLLLLSDTSLYNIRELYQKKSYIELISMVIKIYCLSLLFLIFIFLSRFNPWEKQTRFFHH